MKRIVLLAAIICGSGKIHAALRTTGIVSQIERAVAIVEGKRLHSISITELKSLQAAMSSSIQALNDTLAEYSELSLELDTYKARLENSPAITPADIRKKTFATQQLATQEAELRTQTGDLQQMLGQAFACLEKIKQELQTR